MYCSSCDVPIETAAAPGKKVACPSCEAMTRVPLRARRPRSKTKKTVKPEQAKLEVFERPTRRKRRGVSRTCPSCRGTVPAGERRCPACGVNPKLEKLEQDYAKDYPFEGKQLLEENDPHKAENLFNINGGIAGGMSTMILSIVGFLVGLMFHRIFIFLPIVFCIGFAAVIKGLFSNPTRHPRSRA